MRILGIDPGFGRVGYGVIDYVKNKYRAIEYGCISTTQDMPFPQRLNKIEKDLEEQKNKNKIYAKKIEKHTEYYK